MFLFHHGPDHIFIFKGILTTWFVTSEQTIIVLSVEPLLLIKNRLCVIVIDSNHTDNFKTLRIRFKSQMSIKGNGHTFNRESLGIPIAGIGRPLVMLHPPEKNTNLDVLITTDIADAFDTAAFVIAYGIFCMVYPDIGPKKVEKIMREI